MEWGDLLRVSQHGMWASRRFLWDESARNIAAPGLPIRLGW